MRVIRLSSEDQSRLDLIRKTDARYRVRDRAHALLLSSQGKKIKELALIFDVDRDTISSWLLAGNQRALMVYWMHLIQVVPPH